MKTLFIAISATVLFSVSLFAQSGWYPVYSEIDFAGQEIFFINENTGYNAGGSWTGGSVHPRIWKTTNAGINWFEQTTPLRDSINYLFRGIHFVNSNTGFVTVAYAISNAVGKILKTTDGGNSWNYVSLPVSKHMVDVYFPNSSTGYASGLQTILKTTDTGITWILQNSNFSNYLFQIHFLNENTGYVAGNLGTVLRTTDGGANWWSSNTNTSQNLWGVNFANENTGIASGGISTNSQNIIIRTSDGGLNWTQIPYTGSTCLLWSVNFISPTTGYIIGWCDQILKTLDAGLTWHNQLSPTDNQSLRTCFFTNAQTGYITGENPGFGENGYILKTTDGGGIFVGVNNSSSEVTDNFNLSQNYPNPFNPVTTIIFSLPHKLSPSGLFGAGEYQVKLVIYDVTGRELNVLVNDEMSVGTYEVKWNASGYTSGVYFYSLQADDYSETKRMILLK